MCGMHWRRTRRTGNPGIAGFVRDPNRSIEERIFPRLTASPDGCWLWGGAVSEGYGVVGQGQDLVFVHRWTYEFFRADIPDGLVIDHLCCNRSCANPWHMEPVTRAENNKRGGFTTQGERRRAG